MTKTPNHLIDTKIQIATCPQCTHYVLKAQTTGLWITADPAPLEDMDAYTQAILNGRRVFNLHMQAGRPHKLQTRTPASPPPTWGHESTTAAHKPVVAEHNCTAHGMDATRVPQTPQDTRGVCQIWQDQGWTPPTTCPRQADAAQQSCDTCEPPPFDHPPTGDNQSQETDAIQTTAQKTATGAPTEPHTITEAPTHPEPPTSHTQPHSRSGTGIPRAHIDPDNLTTHHTQPRTPTRPLRCHTCHQHIRDYEPYIAIEHPHHTWAHHTKACG